jgi:hypothetical protein
MEFIITLAVAVPVGMFLMAYILEGGDQRMGQFAWMLLQTLLRPRRVN